MPICNNLSILSFISNILVQFYRSTLCRSTKALAQSSFHKKINSIIELNLHNLPYLGCKQHVNCHLGGIIIHTSFVSFVLLDANLCALSPPHILVTSHLK
ncbi:unnamed protein product [Ilex paraguariensis]|uniref:Uncharacterized protein n=1 Tax=Ilex paraguariensis TaxID=185542 RepID=A0ABC8RWF2_9AQUA